VTTSQCAALLEGCGFTSVEVLDAAALARRYLHGRPDLRLPASTLVAIAGS